MKTAKQLILNSLTPHQCTRFSCGTDHNPLHEGCLELDSDVFIEATELVKAITAEPLPPN